MSTVASRAVRALRAPHNWVQLAKFCVVGASGYVINLAVYTALLKWAGLHYLAAAFISFLVAAGLGKIPAQAIAIVLVTPLNFLGNRLWSFRHRR